MQLDPRAWIRAASLVAALTLPLAAAEPERHWPQWRGPSGQGVSEEDGLPARWSPTENVTWKTAIPGRGHSSPIVWGDRIFLTTAVEGEPVAGAGAPKHMMGEEEFVHPEAVGADREHELKLLALDRSSGTVVWERTAWKGTPYDDRHRRASFASETPVTDGARVYASFGSQGLYAYDFEGKRIWRAQLGPIAAWGVGTGSSPVLYGELVIVQVDEGSGERSYVAGFDRRTGEPVWRASRTVQASWATPLLAGRPDRPELVTSGNELVIAYDPRSGAELWRAEGLGSNAVATPVAVADVVILASGHPKKKVVAIRTGGSGDVTGSDRVLWSYEKGTGYVSSPIAVGGRLYLTSDKGIVTCLDPLTGDLVYEGGRVPVPATVMASPVAFGETILITNTEGDSFVVKAGPEHAVLGTNSVGEAVWASPALAGGQIFVRGESHLFAIGTGPSS